MQPIIAADESILCSTLFNFGSLVLATQKRVLIFGLPGMEKVNEIQIVGTITAMSCLSLDSSVLLIGLNVRYAN